MSLRARAEYRDASYKTPGGPAPILVCICIPTMAIPLHRQPFKGLYIAYIVLSLVLVRLPFWGILYLLPAGRPRRAWTYTRALTVSLVRLYADTLGDTLAWRDTVYASGYFEREEDKHGLVWVDPAPWMVRGEIRAYAETNGVAAVRVAGYWYGKRGLDGKVGQKAEPGEKVLFDLHSGGWVAGDASPKGPSAHICTAALKHLPEITRAFSLDYRLAVGAPHPASEHGGAFPSALVDAAAGFHYLVHTLGFAPNNIIVCGASCGGNLALALVRLLRALSSEHEHEDARADEDEHADKDEDEYMYKYDVPGALLLISPTADWGTSTRGAGSSFAQNEASDFVGGVWRGYVHRAWLGALPLEEAETNVWLSPASLRLPQKDGEGEGTFRGFPRTFVQAGGAEMTLDGMRVLRDRMGRDLGGGEGGERVMYVEVPDGTHMVMAWAWHEPEASECWARFAGWYRSLSLGGGK
ncbi:hypothetical protein EIP86_009896 [Pleurotus ostreatoroseus]|nr:hypothetical protein EIP86_009896 [Pleurotus ostreatoroseus]